MRDKIGFIVIVMVVGAAAVLGYVKRGSYTDIVHEEDFMEEMSVAELVEKLAVFSGEQMEQTLPEAPVILKVSPVEEREYFFMGGRQKVTVLQVYKGEGPEVGQEVYVTFRSWSVSLTESSSSVECGFVNTMKKGQEYLVFLDVPFEGLDGECAYPFYGETVIAPVFCCEDTDNRVVSIENPELQGTYVPYASVKENEFFAVSEEAMQRMIDLKRRMLERYLVAK